MKLITVGIVLLAAMAGDAYASGAKLTAEEIIRKAAQGMYTRSESSTYAMKLVDTDGAERARKMKVWFKRGGESEAKLLIKFTEPGDLRGTGLLSVVKKGEPSDQWLYIPAYKKTRRIRGGNENEAFLGSDFTVGDLTSVDTEKDRYAYSLEQVDQPCGDARCYVLVAKARKEVSELPYARKVLEVRQDNLMTRKIEFYGQDGKLEKVLTMSADRMEMKNVLKGSKTVIEVQDRDTSATPADSVFTQTSLERT